jgi:DNA-binding transcriptional LysR family regulator
MIRSNLLNDVWTYLPAFRAVAESEHLPTAAAELHVVPSALSRSVRLLEEALGERLFTRRGRRLALNSRGRALLDAIRQGQRSLEHALRRGESAAFEGELRVGTIGVLTNHVVLPALLELSSVHPALVPAMKNLGARAANHHLVLGSLDLAFYYDAVPHPGVWCVRLGALSASIYCGRGHPLFRARRVSEAALLAHPFSVPSIGDRNVSADGWPVGLERKVGFRIELLLTNLEVSLSGRFLTVLPDVVALEHTRRGRLRRFPFRIVPDIEVFGACREGEEDLPLHAMLIGAIQARLGGAHIGERIATES